MSNVIKINEDVIIPATLSQQYLAVKKQIADRQTQKDQLMKQVNQKDNEINILTKNLIAIETKAAQEQGKQAAVKSGEVAQPENKEAATSNESVSMKDLISEINEMEEWISEMNINEFQDNEEESDMDKEYYSQDEDDDVPYPGGLTQDDEDDEDGPAKQDKENVFAIRVKDPDEEEEIIAKVYKNEADDFWKIRVVQGSEEPLETMKFDPDMEFVDVMEKIAEIYDEVEEVLMEEYQELLNDKEEEDSKYDWGEE